MMNKPFKASFLGVFGHFLIPAFIAMVVAGFIVQFWVSLPWLAMALWIGAFVLLFLELGAQFSRGTRPRFDWAKARRSVRVVGQFMVDERGLILADTVDLRNRMVVSDMPPGLYKVTAHALTSGGRLVISRVTFAKGRARRATTTRKEFNFGAGYGFVVVLNEGAGEPLNRALLEQVVEQLVASATTDALPVRLIPSVESPTGLVFLEHGGGCECRLTTDSDGNAELILASE